MIGVSLPFGWMIDENQLDLDRASTLNELRAAGVGSVELRTVRSYHPPEDVLRAAELLWSYGFSITVHAEMKSEASAVGDVFTPLSLLLNSLKQKTLNVTVHPIDGDNATVLNRLADHVEENEYPVMPIELSPRSLMPRPRVLNLQSSQTAVASLLRQITSSSRRRHTSLLKPMFSKWTTMQPSPRR